MYILFFLISFVASVSGAICGIGGGVIIKPVLDSFGLLDVKTISFLSGCTVLAMSGYSFLISKIKKESLVDMRIGTPLAVGAAVGGILGKNFFQSLVKFFDQNKVGAIQAGILLAMTLGALLYTIYKDKIKTLSLSNQVPEGFVLSNEINYSRAKKLLSNVERLGLKNVVVSSTNSNYLKKIYEGYFDVILIDAPCSGEGMFRKDDVARKDWSTEKIIKLSQIQKQLLEDSASMLKENGYLIYSTCTFSLEENEQQISNFLKHHDFHIVELPSKFDLISQKGIKIDQYSTDLSRRCYPFRYGEGQFMIVLQKNEQVKPNIIKNSLQELTKQEKTIVQEFLSANVNQNYTIKKYQSNIVILPSTIDIPKLPLLSCFVKMGDILSGRFIPHHQFIKAYGEHFKRTCDLKQNDPRVEQYLKGEEIRASVEDGYGVILIEGYPLGLYKAKNGILKNHYPKGLRK